ncbi:unnamed protein product [Albugo candida]|uniref:Uncharacterized protein n=1 Tax=Albugo candida TaxID=65357 RepID=A0A024G410_9STRA|nr:unnamed protein product [Albugo candida]|eukprot:CCI41490.1 unnamed protein product [Albugo candida]
MTTIRSRLKSCIKSGRSKPEWIRRLHDGASTALEAAIAFALHLQMIYFLCDCSAITQKQLFRDPNAFDFSNEWHTKPALKKLDCSKFSPERARYRFQYFIVWTHQALSR